MNKDHETNKSTAALILVCDGMGRLSRGEIASEEVMRSLTHWFDSQLPFELPESDWHTAANNITSRLRRLNTKLMDFGRSEWMQLETTSTGIIALIASP